MPIKFDKMQALGNDFVMIDRSQFRENSSPGETFFSDLFDRHYGIGCDSVVLYELQRSDTVTARFFNPDGGEAEICGNAARCIGLLLKKRNGLSQCTLQTKKRTYSIGIADEISVDMGPLSLDPRDIGLSKENLDPLSVIDELDLPKDLRPWAASCAAIGNPHLALFLKEMPDEDQMKSIGAALENHPLFKNRINVSFAHLKSENEIILSVFERGAGLTLACGSGACASAALAHANGLTKSKDILVHQKGGPLRIFIDENENIFQTGTASHVFSGEIKL